MLLNAALTSVYCKDNIVPLARDGPTPVEPKWQTVATARAKDRWETQGVRPSGSAAYYMVA
jgi:hypothetical protein